MAAIHSGRISMLYEKAVKAELPDYMGLIFEKMCREYLLYYAENLPFIPRQIGQGWGNDSERRQEIQIDIVASSVDEKEFIIGSCKFRNEPIGMDELVFLQQYAEVFRRGAKFYFYIFSKSGFSQALQEAAKRGEVLLVTLEDMYS